MRKQAMKTHTHLLTTSLLTFGFLLAGCDAFAPEPGTGNFSLDALEVTVETDPSGSYTASLGELRSTETNVTDAEFAIEMTNTGNAVATDVSLAFHLYANEVRPDGSCEYCGDRVGGMSFPRPITLGANESYSTSGGMALVGDFNGELCYEYELEGAPENGDLQSESYAGSCADVDWR